ncbi:hypothetical protein BU16DRAFT_530300 [Lophium mytilinum]|uniref:Uncharacterized protein n=1 Tax=Lophium mytilinum TaxID=390894 RepID=A0A6A6QIP6_9PEZI|nr:hypothetical protein BU16DRAFT_530300 [Lophium mytilinum]
MINQEAPSHYKLEESTTPISSTPNMTKDPSTRDHKLHNLSTASARIDEMKAQIKDQTTQIEDLLQQVAQFEMEKSAAAARSAERYVKKLDAIFDIALYHYERDSVSRRDLEGLLKMARQCYTEAFVPPTNIKASTTTKRTATKPTASNEEIDLVALVTSVVVGIVIAALFICIMQVRRS